MNESTSEGQNPPSNTPSAFSGIRNAKSLKEVMSLLEEENIAAIVEAIRQERWAEQLIPLYASHPNHVIRYEIACSRFTPESDLEVLSHDLELIVRQGALKNLRFRLIAKKLKENPPVKAPQATPAKEKLEQSQNKDQKSQQSTTNNENSLKALKKSKKEKKKNKKEKKNE